MATIVYSVDNKNRRKWVADFNHSQTAQWFVNKSNSIYAGHMQFIMEEK